MISTFSIVARDSKTGELGVAVRQSKFVAVGSVVPYAKAGVGAIASQAWGNPRYGPIGLELLASGKSALEAVDLMTSPTPIEIVVSLLLLESREMHLFLPDLNAWNGQAENMERVMQYRAIF